MDDLISVTKSIAKTIKKRDHKRSDYDRYRKSYKKLKEKKDRTSAEEKNLSKVQLKFKFFLYRNVLYAAFSSFL